MPFPTRFAQFNISMFDIAYLTDASQAFRKDKPFFTRWQADRRIIFILFGQQLSRSSGRSYQLTSSTDLELNIMDHGS
jgi:hypothetical protein